MPIHDNGIAEPHGLLRRNLDGLSLLVQEELAIPVHPTPPGLQQRLKVQPVDGETITGGHIHSLMKAIMDGRLGMRIAAGAVYGMPDGKLYAAFTGTPRRWIRSAVSSRDLSPAK